jgi:integrase
MFEQKFGSRCLHEITVLQVKDWAADKSWGAKTRNDVLGLLSLFYRDMIERCHAIADPAKIKRERLATGDVEIFTPGEVSRILNAVEDRLKPFFAMMFFSGLRKEELSRLTVSQVREGLKSGSIFLPASSAKTNRSRGVPLRANLVAWLTCYLPADGMLLPKDWNFMQRLDDLPAYAERKSGVEWKRNGARHSFGSYALRLTGDPAQVVKEMGNSLVQLDRHYSSRADSVTPKAAQEYFSIVPALPAEVVPLPQPVERSLQPPALIQAGQRIGV